MADIVEFTKSVIMAARVRNVGFILADLRAIPPNLGEAGAEVLRVCLGKPNIRDLGLSIAGMGSSLNYDALTRLETICRDLSINFRLFPDEDAAMAWLNVQHTP